MAWVVTRTSGKYLIDRNPNYSEPLGMISDKAAEKIRKRFEVDKENRSENTNSAKLMSLAWQRFIEHLQRQDYSPRTIDTHRAMVYPFVSTLQRVNELSEEVIQKWHNTLLAHRKKNGEPLKPETIGTNLKYIQSFCTWLVEEEKIFKISPFKLSIPEGRKDAGRALRPSEVVKLLSFWPTSSRVKDSKPLYELSKLFFDLKFHGGFRLTELLGDEEHPDRYPGAAHENLDRQLCILKLSRTKNKEGREVALPREIIAKIPHGVGPMFRGKISKYTLRNHLIKAMKAADITGRLRIHDARVTSATHWARKNRDVRSSMDQFGWKTEKMAVHYNKVATDERVAQAQKMKYD